MPNNFTVIYKLIVQCPTSVELCIKSAMYKYKYRKNKDYYDCPIEKIKSIFDRCAYLVFL